MQIVWSTHPKAATTSSARWLGQAVEAEHRADAFSARTSPDLLRRLAGLVESGPFEIHVAETFALEDASEAQRRLDSHLLGKLALRVRA